MSAPLFRYPGFSPVKAACAVAYVHERLGPGRTPAEMALALFLAERAHVVLWGGRCSATAGRSGRGVPWPEATGVMIEEACDAPCLGEAAGFVARYLSASDTDVLRRAAAEIRRDADAARAGIDALPVHDGRYSYTDFVPADFPHRDAAREDLRAAAPYLSFGPRRLATGLAATRPDAARPFGI